MTTPDPCPTCNATEVRLSWELVRPELPQQIRTTCIKCGRFRGYEAQSLKATAEADANARGPGAGPGLFDDSDIEE